VAGITGGTPLWRHDFRRQRWFTPAKRKRACHRPLSGHLVQIANMLIADRKTMS
jgi:hypothetical protein